MEKFSARDLIYFRRMNAGRNSSLQIRSRYIIYMVDMTENSVSNSPAVIGLARNFHFFPINSSLILSHVHKS